MKNLTPHAITLIPDDRDPVTFPPSGDVARLTEEWPETEVGPYGPEVGPPTYGEVLGVPVGDEPVLVSAFVGPVLARTRKGVYSPDTGPLGAVRNDRGQIVGCRRLVRWS